MGLSDSAISIYFAEPRFSRMVFYSVFAHLVIFGLLVGIPPAQKNFDFSPFYTVDLVNLPPSMLSLPSAKPGVETNKSMALLEGVKNAKKSTSQEKDLSKELDATLAKIREKVVKDRERSGEEDIARTIAQIREKIAIKGEGGVSQTRLGPVGLTQRTSASAALVPGSYQMNLYLTVIWDKIRNSWNLSPALVQGKKDLESIIDIKISRKGEILDMSFEKRSGNHYLDDSAIRAIKKANPLPPLPEVFREEYLEIGIRFIPSDLGGN
jgi:colicin import membrane protein